MTDYTEKSCYWSHFGHQRNECPTCENDPPCPKCGSMDRMKNVSAMGKPDKWMKCFNCDHQTDQFNTFKEAMESFYGKALQN